MLRISKEEKDPKTKTPRHPLAAIITKSTLRKRLPGSWEWSWERIGNSPMLRWDCKLATVTLEKSVDVYLRKEKRSYHKIVYLFPEGYPEKNILAKVTGTVMVVVCIIYNSQGRETTQASEDRWTEKESMPPILSGQSLSPETQWKSCCFKQLNGPEEAHTKSGEADRTQVWLISLTGDI